MDYKITVKGMHCEACKSLISMELEDHGLIANLSEISLLGSETGELIFNDISEEKYSEIVKIINNLENYQVSS